MKNWTLRQRILASFAVIIAIMLLMVVASYSRLLSIESSEETVRTDSIPGVYYSSMVRSAWVDSYVLTLQLVGSATQRDLTSEDRKLYASYEDRMTHELDNYRTTIFDDQDRAEFDEFERIHGQYTKALAGVLQFYEDKKTEQADAMLNEQLAPLWAAGRKQLNTIIDTNRTQASRFLRSSGTFTKNVRTEAVNQRLPQASLETSGPATAASELTPRPGQLLEVGYGK